MSFKTGSAIRGRSAEKQATWTSGDLKISPHVKKVISKSPVVQKLKNSPGTRFDVDNVSHGSTGSRPRNPDSPHFSQEEDEDREIQEIVAQGNGTLPNLDPSRSSVDLEREMDRLDVTGFPTDDDSVYESAAESLEVSIVPKGISDDRDSSIYESPAAEIILPEINSPRNTRGKPSMESGLGHEMEELQISVESTDIGKSKPTGNKSASACLASPILNRLGQTLTPRLDANSPAKSPQDDRSNTKRPVSTSANPDKSLVSRGLSNLRKLFRSSSLPSLDKNESPNAGDGKGQGGPGEGELGPCMGDSSQTNTKIKVRQGEGPSFTVSLYIRAVPKWFKDTCYA